MKYYHLESMIAGGKNVFSIKNQSDSFYISSNRHEPYIEPEFTKDEFEFENPSIILISAVGATGKSTLARVLSYDKKIPLLDLGIHKPVGDNTLTGLLSKSFYSEDLSNLYQGIDNGSYGVIVDGIDEGRSKTTEKAFEAFLDDIVEICGNSSKTSFVLLGRTQILEDCWLYFSEKGVTTGLIIISPFNIEQAYEYIDKYVGTISANYRNQYQEVRDNIINKLGAAFNDTSNDEDKEFLSFIGYPPVLDAVATLLKEEKNYHKLSQGIQTNEVKNIEINLLCRIASYILQRERDEKVIPNIINSLINKLSDNEKEDVLSSIYNSEEQFMRLISFCLNRPLRLNRISNKAINEKYEEQLCTFLHEHPFISKGKFRNAVFESIALATLMISNDPQCEQLILNYITLSKHKHSYHLIYLLNMIAPNGHVPIKYLQILIQSALEFRSANSSVELFVECPEVDDLFSTVEVNKSAEIRVEILLGKEREKSKIYIFNSNLESVNSICLGHTLSSTTISLPCELIFSGSQEIELIAPIQISAKQINLQAETLILKSQPNAPSNNNYVFIESENVISSLHQIETNGIDLSFIVSEINNIAYPVINHTERRPVLSFDDSIKEKYIRLRRILMQFRSHSRGALAKYRDKINHERILRNSTGKAILDRLVLDNILTLRDNLYFLEMDQLTNYLDISWFNLRKGQTSEKLLKYLSKIQSD